MELNERVFGGPMGDRIKWFQSAIAWGPRFPGLKKKENPGKQRRNLMLSSLASMPNWGYRPQC